MAVFYAVKIRKDKIRKALEEIQKGDEMHGNKVQRIDKIGSDYLVIFKRKNSYRFVTDKIKEEFDSP